MKQQCLSPCSSKSLSTFNSNTPRYCLLLCPGQRRRMPSFAFPYTLIVKLSLPLRTPHESLDRSHGLSSPGILTQPPSIWVGSNPRLDSIAISIATLLQYVDDLLLCGQTEPVILQATESLLNFLANRGNKIS
jgi:hypothetical protein